MERSHDKRQRGVVAMAVTERDGANQRVRDGGGGVCVYVCGLAGGGGGGVGW